MSASAPEAETAPRDWPRFHKTSARVAGELVYAIGDIHGCYDLLTEMLRHIAADARSRARGRTPILVTCGDYIDRGPDSARVLTALDWIRRDGRVRLHAIKGNHEAAFLSFPVTNLWTASRFVRRPGSGAWPDAMTSQATRDLTRTDTDTDGRPAGRSILYQALIGLCALAVLLQGLWAGIFLEHDGQRDAASGWIDVHARGADVALALAVVATVVAFWKLRARRELWLGSLALVVLLALESWLGGAIRDDGKDVLTAVHVPLAMAIMALVVWLPFRARRSRPA